MRLAPIIISAFAAALLCSCADKEMYEAYVDVTKSNNSIEREKLSQQGKTARTAINSQRKVIPKEKDRKKKKSEKSEKSKKGEYLIKMASIQRTIRDYENDWHMIKVSSGPPCTVVCAEGCSSDCFKKCPDLCDAFEVPPIIRDQAVNEENEETETVYGEPEYKSQQKIPTVNVIGSTNVTINFGAGASTTSGENKEKNRQVKIPKSIGHIATEKAFSLGESLLKWGSIFGIVDSTSDGISRISESPNYYVDNAGRSEVFDSRNQSTSGSFNGE